MKKLQESAHWPNNAMKVFYMLFGILGIVGIGLFAFSMSESEGDETGRISARTTNNIGLLLGRAIPITIGDPGAPAQMVVFSDFQCPYCARFSLEVKPRLVSDLVSTGKLYITLYDFPMTNIHKHATVAAMAARCAGDQDKYWEYHDLLFTRLSEWSARPDAPLDDFDRYAVELGLNRATFSRCLEGKQYAEVVDANRRFGEELRVTGTPTVFLNGRRVPGNVVLNYEALANLIEEEVGA